MKLVITKNPLPLGMGSVRYIGDGKYFTEIENYLTSHSLTNSFILTGFRADACELLQIFDIYLLTSLYEGLPYSLIEALSVKLPILATDIVGNNELVFNEYNGFLFEVKNAAEAVSKLQYMIQNRDSLQIMSANSFSLYNQKFTLDKMIKILDGIYS